MTQYSKQSRYYHHLFCGTKVVVCNNDQPIVEIKLFDNFKKNVGAKTEQPQRFLNKRSDHLKITPEGRAVGNW